MSQARDPRLNRTKLEFVKEQYGPYADALNHVLQRMEGHFIRGYGDRSGEASVRVLDQGVTAANALMAEEDHLVGRVQRVAELIEGFETPHGIQENDEAKTRWEVSFELLQDWNERKRRIFPIPHVQAAFSQLESRCWI